jgi:hypothetical protein
MLLILLFTIPVLVALPMGAAKRAVEIVIEQDEVTGMACLARENPNE